MLITDYLLLITQARDSHGVTPLHAAAEGHYNVVEYLLQELADSTIRDHVSLCRGGALLACEFMHSEWQLQQQDAHSAPNDWYA